MKKSPSQIGLPIQPIYQALGARIRMIRDAIGVDQATLAKRVQLSRPAIANIEVGRQRVLLDQVQKIAEGLGTTPKHLLRGIWF